MREFTNSCFSYEAGSSRFAPVLSANPAVIMCAVIHPRARF
jgi:hypothetical protein